MADSNTGAVKKIGRPKGSKDKKKRTYTMTEKAHQQRVDAGDKGYPIIPPDGELYDQNNRILNHILQVNEIATHADRSDINTLRSCFVNYVRLCQHNGFPVTNLAAYSAMGFRSPKDFQLFASKDDPECRQLVAMVKNTCAMFRESLVSEGKLNPVIGIFWQRNFDGLRNDTEQIQAAQEQEEEVSTSSSYKEKYKNLIGK